MQIHTHHEGATNVAPRAAPIYVEEPKQEPRPEPRPAPIALPSPRPVTQPLARPEPPITITVTRPREQHERLP